MTSFAHCSAWWNYSDGDFSSCFEHDYLQTLVPLVACGISVLIVALQAFRKLFQQNIDPHGYTKLDNSGLNGTTVAPGERAGDEADDTEDEEEEEFERNEELALRPKRSQTGLSTITVDRPSGEIAIAVVEELAVFVEIGIQVAALILNAWGKNGTIAAAASVATWGYIAVLTSMRLLLSSTSQIAFPKLWYHTAVLYGIGWICAILLFRSEIIYPRSTVSQALTSAHFGITTILFLIALMSRKGNKPVELEYEGDLEPSKEPLASLFSLATFSWIDPIVWTGYRKTTEMSDVWNLNPKDKASAILADYRQCKKTTILAFHLLKYFKRGLITQALWASISGVVTFVPTLLLKVILQYVEDPASTPRNAAWFYVILLFVSGVVNALSSGQALWVGRKVCIRLRAIIIGEIYAKALRRRAAAGADKVLGQGEKKDEKEKEGLLKKIMSFGRKKKSDKGKSGGNAEEADDSQVTSGAIINLMAVDSFKVAEVSAYLHFLWAETPVQFVLAIVLLYQILGYSSIAGIGTMGLLLPINMWISKQFATVQKQILAATDARIHTTNEVLTNIRIIKYFAWEQRFLGGVEEKRRTELRYLRNRYIIWATAATIWSGAPVLITFLTFLVYTVVEKKDLIPSIAFTALSLFSLLRIPLDQLADMVAHVQESKVSVDRVEEYLNEPETDKYRQLEKTERDDDGEVIIGFDKATFSWGGRDSDDFKMIDMDLRFKVGQLNIIIGPTGSGKTSLLMALLGEMSLLEGSVYLPGGRSREDLKVDPDTGLTESVAYCAQQAWLVNGTIKENIVFASKWDARRYKNVIVACSLQRDLEILDSGDQTIVGEKGVTLSGGQKQRISLARALYCNARHVLMDDVLSAVDSHTAKWIFEKALMGPLMYNRTCILVTHNATLCLPPSEFAVLLENGRVATQGPPSKVISSGLLAEDMSKFESKPASKAASTLPSRVPSGIGGEEPLGETSNGHTSVPNGEPTGVQNGEPLSKVVSKDIPGMNNTNDSSGQEKKAEGAVKLQIITMYLSQMGGWFYWSVAALCFALQQVSQVSTTVWIRQWANAYTQHEAISTLDTHHASPISHVRGGISGSFNCLRSGSCIWSLPSWQQPSTGLTISALGSEVDVGYYLGVYGVLGIAYMIITFLREGVLFGGSLAASTRIHRTLMENVTHAKFRFFDSTPLGQIMNRFSKDIESVDQEIAPVAVGVVHCLASIITIVVLISVITPGFLIAGVFITALYFLIGKFYINSSRDLKRLESVQRSPLYQQFGETLSGMTTIRAYGDERRFIRENIHRVNTHSRPFIYLWGANRWLAFRVDVVGALVSFFTGVFVLLSVGRIDAGAAGLAMTYAVTFTENVLWFVRLYASNEQNMNSVERVKEYLDVDQEAAMVVPENRPDANWPSKGSVEFIGYSTRYRDDFDFVLKNLTFKIMPGEKVGVVGRTGAGKSSMALALFRALEAEQGKILIDDVDIGLIGLQDLRENIVMVPQDPTLFTGTIRTNLDPFGLFTDEEIFTALRGVQLVGAPSATGSAAPSRPQTPVNGTSTPTKGSSSAADTSALENKNIFRNLNSQVAESGSNLSQGQRQLLCLARALLKAPKVLLMDEATASIDYATDSRIQETIREIRNTTVTIAHRLQTIIDYDKVLVLDKGEVIEYGDPFDLVSKEGGIFRGMCEMSGDFDVLEREAAKAHDARRLVDDS
ncbi:bile acid-transporting ATPase [Hortaea werneckii]|uniref:ATP-dependent bile acid permease n=1 Tax=Hortaea werneckii TaxID=91943 RepID=A0A3M7ITY1_HORWE|nr:bile acid-transporting ATPase [Hortaea werneckii]KAI6846737.1 bile acid-transporting ATPase [Hortaea werneckii]KAI6944077.1 bile acid-transporting ATPase [Hortaea werneckii]KAI6981988.1 bile acid-transporting ATPase [Hortaea werneckii]KAI6998795.1 bile acid-transporting ATPase [Hortaea werneckii]